MSNETTSNYIELAAGIVSAFVTNNSVPASELPSLIGSVHAALQNIGQPAGTQEEAKPTPAVSVKKSITPDFLISLEDGKQYKSLKRHLGKLGLTPEAYREKWGLPREYPMVAPNYAAQRSELAKSMGLGQKRRKTAQAKAAANDVVQADAPKAPAKRGRKKAA
ncbi:MucR family transcriptional regulator [Microvirga splendida]|uniref:MucR family transcriptional regulator n=1 Tax=Microvirga splendida TaxID=2795727 RepID=A0ABS0XWC8_9HYPH|nr:MucR family transcriptional regulator [Microvirga splendida]MBJ6124040.1 MucR family transcriptional regulator [Microvirga splendida]